MCFGFHRHGEWGAVIQSAERLEIHIDVPASRFRRKTGQPTGDGEIAAKECARSSDQFFDDLDGF